VLLRFYEDNLETTKIALQNTQIGRGRLQCGRPRQHVERERTYKHALCSACVLCARIDRREKLPKVHCIQLKSGERKAPVRVAALARRGSVAMGRTYTHSVLSLCACEEALLARC